MIKNLKKVISTFAAVAILATSASAFAAFPDVDASASYAGSVDALTALGIVNGDENGKFNPDNTVTRAEFAKMVVESMGEGSAAASSTTTKFTDAASHWAAGYIEVGVGKGFINGYDDTTFGPDDQVTYAQAVKMLVAAIGYDTYASKQGGWPSGYLAYGSSLDIIKGVTGVTNDTALTRAQCAVLIYNTLKAPICKVDGYEENYKGELVPKYKEMDGTGKNWQTLLTTEHDAYVVRGRVQEVNKKDAEVYFNVEAAENFDGLWIGKSNDADDDQTAEWMNVGTTDAANMKFVYSEAIVQKDEDTSEYTLISVTPYGAVKTVEFAATDLKTSFTQTQLASNGLPSTIEVKKEGTTKTTTYKMEDDYEIYVNGELIKYPADDDDTTAANARVIADALAAANKRGTVTLIDETATGSTSTNGYYDKVMVTLYSVTQVTDVRTKNDDVIIDTADGKIQWTPDDEDSDVTVDIFKDGAAIEYSDVKVDDVLLILADPTVAFKNSDWVEIYVSDKVVTGTVTGRKTTANKEALKIDNVEYPWGGAADDDVTTGSVQTLWLDAMGFIYKYEEGEGSKNLGIVLSMYKGAGDDNETVRLVDGTGETVEYEVKDAATAAAIREKVGVGTGAAINKMTAASEVPSRVIRYTVSSGKLKFDPDSQSGAVLVNKDENGDPITNLEYKASTEKLGKYAVSKTATTVVNLESYLTGGSIEVFSAENFEDEAIYDAYVFDRSANTGVCGFVVLTSGINTLKAKSALAIVTESGEVANNEDGEECKLIKVARNGEEDIEVLVDPAIPDAWLAEGTIIMYTVGADGYVEKNDNNDFFKVIYSPKDSYEAMDAAMFASGVRDFRAVAGGLVVAGNGGYTLNFADAVTSDVEIFFGPVYKSSTSVVDILLNKNAEGYTDSDDAESITIGNANVYTVDYGMDPGYGERVSKGGVTQNKSFYDNMYTRDSEGVKTSLINWALRLVDPNNAQSDLDRTTAMAFVRVVDGVTTDVVYFLAN